LLSSWSVVIYETIFDVSLVSLHNLIPFWSILANDSLLEMLVFVMLYLIPIHFNLSMKRGNGVINWNRIFILLVCMHPSKCCFCGILCSHCTFLFVCQFLDFYILHKNGFWKERKTCILGSTNLQYGSYFNKIQVYQISVPFA